MILSLFVVKANQQSVLPEGPGDQIDVLFLQWVNFGFGLGNYT